MELPPSLFKFESFNEYSIQNLKNAQIFHNKPINFSDPFDCSTFVESMEIKDEDYLALYNRAILSGMEGDGVLNSVGEIPEEFKVKSKKGVYDFAEEMQQRYLYERGCSCFSECNDHILMWSHYANGHRGFCLEFDTKYEPFSSALCVEYSELFPRVNPVKFMLAPDTDTRSAMLPLLTKFTTWAYEKEWRIFHMEPDKLYGYPIEALKAVYFGSEMQHTNIEIICLILQGQSPNVEFYQSNKSKKEFKVEFSRFEYTPFKDINST